MTGTQHQTSKKARIKGAFEFLEAKKLPYRKNDLFAHFEVSKATGYRILAEESSRTRHNNPEIPETRGRKRKLSEAGLDKLEDLYDEEGFEAKQLSWASAIAEAGVDTDASNHAISRAAATRGLYKRLAAEVAYKSEAEGNRRVAYAEKALSFRPEPENWRDVLFSDECHFGYGDPGRARVARKSGTRIQPSNLQERKQPEEGEKKRIHCWAAIGYDFKSSLVWYDPGNRNGKMTQVTYEKEILEPYIKRWITEGREFVLEEDGDSGHGPGKSNPVRAWKEKHDLKHYFNCPSSPDLSPIENCWLVPKEYVRKYTHWDNETLKELAEEGWKELSQETINRWIDSMPERLQHVIDMKGKMTGW